MSKTKLMRKIVNCETGEIIEREFTAEEYAQREIDVDNYAKAKKETEAKVETKNDLLERLGITADEAKLLLA